MELIKSAAKRTRVSEMVYVALNILYAAMLLVLLVEFEGQPYLAYLLVILSKWRVLAVRPRFWAANIQTSLLDTILGLSVVTLLWQNMGNLTLQLIITAIFALWLVLLKPLSKRFWVIVQAGTTQFVALMALFNVAHNMHIVIVVALSWLIGFVVARHIINVFTDEYEDIFISTTWGIVIAELGWLTYYWTIAYTPLKIPQIAIIASLLGYAGLMIYNYLYHHDDAKNLWRDMAAPTLFSVAGILILLVFFNGFDPMSF